MKIKKLRFNSNNKALMKRIAFTVGVLVIYDLLTYVTIPGVDPKALSKIAANPTLTMLSIFSGGGFETLSILSMGVSAYISAQIIVQLLQSDVVPKLTEWSKQGQTGRQKLNQFTRWVTLILGIIQSVGIIAGINQLSKYGFVIDNSIWTYCVLAMVLTAGTFMAMWFADQITEKGLGNGISVLIAAGILKRVPSTVKQFYLSISTTVSTNWWLLAGTIAILIVMVLVIVWFNRSEYRMKIQYSRKESQTGDLSYLPLKILVPGMVPVIFASGLLTMPQSIVMFFQGSKGTTWYRITQQFFNLNTSMGATLYAILIIAFTYLYSFVQVEPEKMADNLGKQEAYIVGIRPGDDTAYFVKQKLFELGLPGSLFLTIISIIPLIASNMISASLFMGLSGSSLLIIVGTFTDIGRQIEGLKLKKEYPGFMNEQYSFRK